jgi:hypothetical protein
LSCWRDLRHQFFIDLVQPFIGLRKVISGLLVQLNLALGGGRS